jgi:hypothetical protein
MNRILDEIDVYVSIPKMKQHYDAGVTHSLKNQVGIVPKSYYELPYDHSRRAKLHDDGGDMMTHLPRSICDLNLTRPVHLAVIDGIKNAEGGEGTWNPTFQIAEYDVLLAGKDPVATDSVASYLMGNDPEAEKFQLPDGVRQCDNYLELLHQKGMGTNQMAEIEIKGDGAGLVTSVESQYADNIPEHYKLFQNYPNPFNPTTTIPFYVPREEYVTMKLYNVQGRQIETLFRGKVAAGSHEIPLRAKNLSSGIYMYRIQAGKFSDTKKLMIRK